MHDPNDYDEDERNVGSDSGTEHLSRHESVADSEDYFDDSRDSTCPDTSDDQDKGWFRLW